MKPTTASKTILVVAILVALLTGCSRQVGAEATEFCQRYVSAGELVSDDPAEDGGVWVDDVSGTLRALSELAPEEIEDSFDTVSSAIHRAVETRHETEAVTGVMGTQELARASAVIQTYLETECGWPAWPPSPGYRWSIPHLPHTLVMDPGRALS